MCQFCHQHGDGKTWYLRAENYSQDLLADLGRRKYIVDFINEFGREEGHTIERELTRAMQAPAWLRRLIYWFQERRYRRDHFGQVAPMEDIAQIMDLANSIVRIPCICRKNTKGRTDAEYCFGLGLDAENLLDIKASLFETFKRGPDDGPFERLSKEEALGLMQGFEGEGLIHTIWTFKTPFIGGICNCDRADCLAMLSYRYNFHIFFRGEYVAHVHEDNCIGCRACHSMCQFEAIGYSVLAGKTFIDPIRCYGCGVCRSVCQQDAIHLAPRREHPIASKIW